MYNDIIYNIWNTNYNNTFIETSSYTTLLQPTTMLP